MQYIRDYKSFKESKQTKVEDESMNEEFIGKLLSAATGAFKNFLGNITAPFKALKDDFKKGMQEEEMKKKMTTTIDTILKSATDNINKAEDENAINQIKDAFKKELDEKAAEFDKEIKAVKESKLIVEGAIKNTMVGARVMIGMLKDTAAKIKGEFDKKFAAAKDLAAKKAVAVEELKKIADDFKKQVADPKAFKAAQDAYVQANKIEGVGGEGGPGIILDWGDVEVEIQAPEKGGTTRYKIVKSNSKKLVIPEGKVLFCDISGVAKKGEPVKFEKISIGGTGEGGEGAKDNDPKEYVTGKLEKITVDGKEVNEYKFGEGAAGAGGQEDLTKKLGEMKTKKPEDIKKVGQFVDFISDEKNKDKVKEIEKILSAGGGE